MKTQARSHNRNRVPQTGFSMAQALPKPVVETVTKAVVDYDRANTRHVVLWAGGGPVFSMAQLLVVLHQDLTITIACALLPGGKPVSSSEALRRDALLYEGDQYAVLTAYKTETGMWFSMEGAEAVFAADVKRKRNRFHMGSRGSAIARFPIVLGVTGDPRRAGRLLAAFNAWSGMDVRLSSMKRFIQYRALDSADFHKLYPPSEEVMASPVEDGDLQDLAIAALAPGDTRVRQISPAEMHHDNQPNEALDFIGLVDRAAKAACAEHNQELRDFAEFMSGAPGVEVVEYSTSR